jgi:hypothetical protein
LGGAEREPARPAREHPAHIRRERELLCTEAERTVPQLDASLALIADGAVGADAHEEEVGGDVWDDRWRRGAHHLAAAVRTSPRSLLGTTEAALALGGRQRVDELDAVCGDLAAELLVRA